MDGIEKYINIDIFLTILEVLNGRKSTRLDSPTYRTRTCYNSIRRSSTNYFGSVVPFLGLDIVGAVVALVRQFGSEGLVGLVAVWVLWGIYSKK